MMHYGQTIEAHTLDEHDSKVEYIRNVKDYDVHSAYKRTSTRVRVVNKREEMAEFLIFTTDIDTARKAGTLVRGDRDPSLRPTFTIEMPKQDIDGAYFIVRSYTELMV